MDTEMIWITKGKVFNNEIEFFKTTNLLFFFVVKKILYFVSIRRSESNIHLSPNLIIILVRKVAVVHMIILYLKQ